MLFFQDIMSWSLFFCPIDRMKVASHGSILSLFQKPLLFFSFSQPGPPLTFCCIKCTFLRSCIRIFWNLGILSTCLHLSLQESDVSVIYCLNKLRFCVFFQCCVLLQMILKYLNTFGTFSVVPVNSSSLGTSSMYSNQSSSR